MNANPIFSPSDYASAQSLRVLMLGNNPIELGRLYDLLQASKEQEYQLEVSFNEHDALRKATNFKPDCIVLDDNLDKEQIQHFSEMLQQDQYLRHVPITLVKNSNRWSVVAKGIHEYVLKNMLSTKTLSRAVLNAVRYGKVFRKWLKS
ncbi:response regulator [Persicobacter psychrovividus]|uniref:Response regulatory domain-containing protein n=1 Tax=Persicobacter psychrovividus TaxID=387638 RepID=A0ABM7VH23_9BACT|nr:hypothetical protein PEPS_25660 [Persicobacter psychrovividus]